MGRIHNYPFQWVLFLGENAEEPEFNDDTLVIVVLDDSEFAGKTIDFSEFVKLNWETALNNRDYGGRQERKETPPIFPPMTVDEFLEET